MLRNYSIATRILFLFVFMALLTILTAVIFSGTADRISDVGTKTAQDTLLESERTRLKSLTHTFATSLGSQCAGLPAAEQIAVIAKAIEQVRFESDLSGYFFVYEGTVNAAHPTQKQLIGKDLSQTKDVGGKYYVRELADAARQGGGYVPFVFPKPGQGDKPKLGYAEAIPGTPYWIGSGIYIDNLDAAGQSIRQAMDQIKTKEIALTFGLVLAVLVLCGLPVSIALNRSIVRPLRLATELADTVAKGKLDVSIPLVGADEISTLMQALDSMVRTLAANIEAIKVKEREAEAQAQAALSQAKRADASALVAVTAKEQTAAMAVDLEDMALDLRQASGELAKLSENLQNGVKTQIDRASSTAAAMEQMNSSVLDVARNAAQAASETDASRSKAKEGELAVRDTMEAMQALTHIATDLRANTQQLAGQSAAISQVMDVISDIADQTNLLALNAAIEAARAGAAGRGFAVVADEVRKLAEKTMSATGEVGSTIKAIQSVTEANGQNMDKAMQAIERASTSSGHSGAVLSEILLLADSSAAQVKAISTAASEQAKASQQIAGSVEDMADIAKENGQQVGEADSDIHRVADMAESLRKLIAEMRHRMDQVA